MLLRKKNNQVKPRTVRGGLEKQSCSWEALGEEEENPNHLPVYGAMCSPAWGCEYSLPSSGHWIGKVPPDAAGASSCCRGGSAPPGRPETVSPGQAPGTFSKRSCRNGTCSAPVWDLAGSTRHSPSCDCTNRSVRGRGAEEQRGQSKGCSSSCRSLEKGKTPLIISSVCNHRAEAVLSAPQGPAQPLRRRGALQTREILRRGEPCAQLGAGPRPRQPDPSPQPARGTAPAPGYDRGGSFHGKAKRKVQTPPRAFPPLSSRPDGLPGFTARAKGRAAALDPRAPAPAADGSSGRGVSVWHRPNQYGQR